MRKSWGRWRWVSGIRRRLEVSPDAPQLIGELVVLFFSPLAVAQARYLARKRGEANPTSEELEDQIESFIQPFHERLLKSIRKRDEQWPDLLYLSRELSPEAFKNVAAFRRMLQSLRTNRSWKGRFGAYRLKRDSQTGAAILLGAIQEVALEFIPSEYPPSAKPHPEGLLEDLDSVISSILRNVDAMAWTLRASPQPLPLLQACALLRLARARAIHQVWLPLRAVPAAPLSSQDVSRHYVGRDDREALGLACQMRYADGVVLVTGYRGVGKSSFVNRALHHVLAAQKQPSDCIVVPIVLSLAKTSDTSSALRLTVRALRYALLDAQHARPNTVPGNEGVELPLTANEQKAIREAWLRTVFKVSQTRSVDQETATEIGSEIGLDAGKILGGAAGWGLGLGKLFSASTKRSRVEKAQRQLSLLDYDENAAEDDIRNLSRSLAWPRPMGPGLPEVKIKLVFVFDELDKLDYESHLAPMLNDLKNLFLERESVFVLVTSKDVYYRLVEARSREEDTLGSYFSSVIHVPLLESSQVRTMLGDWLDNESIQGGLQKNEGEFVDRLAGFLTYRSMGNPREINRMLREMHEWDALAGRQYLSSRGADREWEVYGALQEAIEKAPRSDLQSARSASGSLLVSERIKGDEARLEQIQRGLYIITQAVIDRQKLILESDEFTQLHKDNFRLVPIHDVRRQAEELARLLTSANNKVKTEPLFTFAADTRSIEATRELYVVTGLQPPKSVDMDIVAEAIDLSSKTNWTARRTAIYLSGKIESGQLPLELRNFLIDTVLNDTEPIHRLEAAKQLRPNHLLSDGVDLNKLFATQTNSQVLDALLNGLDGAEGPVARARATGAILSMLESMEARPSDETLQTALKLLNQLSDEDIMDRLLRWFPPAPGKALETTVIDTLSAMAEKHKVDVAERIFGNPALLRNFIDQPGAERKLTDWAFLGSAALGLPKVG